MVESAGLWKYVKAAFSARFFGMFFSPAAAILGFFGFLGAMLNPGFFLIGIGVEIAYLFLFATHPRFQGYVQSQMQNKALLAAKAQWLARINKFIQRLGEENRQRFYSLRSRCDSILEFYSTQMTLAPTLIEAHTESLNKLLWIFLQLLMTKQAILRLTQGTFFPKLKDELTAGTKKLDSQLSGQDLSDELRKSLESKRDILKLRLQTLEEARQKLAYIDAEADRIEQQVELIKEQAVVSKDSQSIADRIDTISTGLSQTSDWIKQQEGFLGSLDDMTQTVPSILAKPSVEESA